METLMGHIRQDFPKGFDGYFVFDADNILSPDYIEKMNLTFSSGHDVVTDYRNSKNYGDNWLSAGSGLWYLRENRYLNHARDLLGLSCAVSRTGFLFSRRMAEELGTWPFHSLVEDVEFSIHEITQGRRIAYCPDAVLYDEQPTDFRQSWRQRCRWCKGELKVFGRYGRALIRNIFHGNFSSFDMIMWIMPAYFLTVAAIISNVTLGILGICAGENLLNVVRPIGQMILGMYLTAFMIGAVTTATEWRRIRTGAAKKILYTFTFPLFMFTYIPISIYVLFRKVEWKPIEHRVSRASLKTRDRQEELPFQ